GFCSSTSCQFFACASNSECLNIYGKNSGATCVGGVCKLPPNSGTCVGNAIASIKTNSGNGNVFDVRVSAVIGLLTDVTVTSKQTQPAVSTAQVGIDFTVDADRADGGPEPSMVPNETITFASRFIQVSTNLFQGLAATCTSAIGGCFITFAESTVDAHSFDWIIGSTFNGGPPLSSGVYNITASWAPSPGFAVSGIGEAAGCVGPVNMTSSQNKIFQFNKVNSF